MHKANRSQEEQEEEDNIGVWSLGCLFVLVIRLANNIDLCILCVHFDPEMVKNVYNLLLPNLCYSHMVFIGTVYLRDSIIDSRIDPICK